MFNTVQVHGTVLGSAGKAKSRWDLILTCFITYSISQGDEKMGEVSIHETGLEAHVPGIRVGRRFLPCFSLPMEL